MWTIFPQFFSMSSFFFIVVHLCLRKQTFDVRKSDIDARRLLSISKNSILLYFQFFFHLFVRNIKIVQCIVIECWYYYFYINSGFVILSQNCNRFVNEQLLLLSSFRFVLSFFLRILSFFFFFLLSFFLSIGINSLDNFVRYTTFRQTIIMCWCHVSCKFFSGLSCKLWMVITYSWTFHFSVLVMIFFFACSKWQLRLFIVLDTIKSIPV